MGLHAVSQFLKTKFSSLYHKEHLSLFAHETVYFDVASYIYKFTCVYGTHTNEKVLSYKWFNSFFNLILAFRKNGVIVIPVFDGQAPEAKQREQQTRRDARQKQRVRIEAMRKAIEQYEVSPNPECPVLIGALKGEPMTVQSISNLRETMYKLERQISFVAPEELKFLQSLLSACGICWLQAPEEAEAYCCWFVKNHKGVSAVASCDTDCIAHQADIIIFEVEAGGSIVYMNTSELLEAFDLDDKQIVDFAILVGCDYNAGSRVNGIGPVNALKLLQKHENIENIPNINKEVLHYPLIRTLFNPSYPIEHLDLVQNVPVQLEVLNELVADRLELNSSILFELASLA